MSKVINIPWKKRYENIENKIREILDIVDKEVFYTKLSQHDIVIFALAKRVRSNWSAINLLLKYDFSIEILVIFRSVIESTIVFNALIEETEKAYMLLELLSNQNRAKLHKNVIKNETLKQIALLYDFSKVEKSRVMIQQFSELSKKNDDLYDIIYNYISSAVHINLLSIESLLIKTDKDTYALKNNLDINDIEIHYYTLMLCMNVVLEGLSERFKLNLEDKIESIHIELQNMDVKSN